MGEYRFEVRIAAPVELVFDLWTDLDRTHEWIEGVTRVSDVTGPPGRAGTRYTLWFGSMRSDAEILEAERPDRLLTRFSSRLLRGETEVRFEPSTVGTGLTQTFRPEGLISAILARIFATGSWKGSFRGELATFVRVAEREASESVWPRRSH